MNNNSTISIILPCLNEEASIRFCLEKLRAMIKKNASESAGSGWANCEVIVVDNASTDSSSKIIKEIRNEFPNLILAYEPRRGYGSAYMKGIETGTGTYICMADIDGTYDFSDLPKFISKLKEGYGLVVGNRFDGNGAAVMEKSAMPWHHRWIGNPVLSRLVRICFGVRIHDIHCGMRAVTREAIETISPRAAGMEFASEMVVKAAKRGVRMAEIPIAYRARIGESKLRSFADGWRHLRFILIYCPTALFFIPGVILFGIGGLAMIILYFSSPTIFGIQFYFHPMFFAAAMIIVGYQFIFFGGFARIYAATHLGDSDRALERLFRYVTIEKACVAGAVMAIVGLAVYAALFVQWIHSGFSFNSSAGAGINSAREVKNSIVALTLVIIGIETISSAFMLSIVGIKEK